MEGNLLFTQRYSSNSTLSKFHSILSKILLFLKSDPLFTPYGVIIFYSVLKIIYKRLFQEPLNQGLDFEMSRGVVKRSSLVL